MLDKKWMEINDRASLEYIKGVDLFLEFAFGQPGVSDMIRCPCNRCRNTAYKKRREVRVHLFKKGIVRNYRIWVFHGEQFVETVEPLNVDLNEDRHVEDYFDYDDMIGVVHDTCGFTNMRVQEEEGINLDVPNEEAQKFYRLLKDAEVELYPGCEKMSKLSFIVKLLHMKCLNNLSDTVLDDILKFCQEFLPNDALIPKSYYEARKVIRDLGLDYIKIDACQNDCILYWRENADALQRPVCGLSRWKDIGNQKRIPRKILRHFPLKPRLQRLYMSKKIAKEMRWHKEKRIDDGIMRHPADSMAWKAFDEKHQLFAADSRNIRLGLASDGFQPYGNMSSSHSIWPVVLVPYNLPPWLCMKHPYFMLTLLIPGPKCLENDIDVYLQPLIEELKELWEEGLDTYDAYIQQNFKLHVAVMWTINDFPAYGNLSGWSTKGKLACPCCHKDTCSFSLRNKLCYMDHRRFLPFDHPWRKNKMSFNGKTEVRNAPDMLTGEDVIDQLHSFDNVVFGKGHKRKRGESNIVHNWKKKSIFFQLPYWKTLMLRHNLDVMHIERNVSNNVLGTVLNMKGKTKDTLKSRYDLVDMGIRHNLHPYVDGSKVWLPAATYALSTNEKTIFCKFLANLQVPDGFSSNISRCVNLNGKTISGLKCHDHHILLQIILPLAIRGLLPKDVCEPIIELGSFFKKLCSKTLHNDDLDRLQEQIVITLCKLETIFPPAFFDVMIHLPVHLAKEAKIGGPVQYRWMYPIERYLRTLKSYVRNKARPEGSIAEGYIADECLTFCSNYLHGVRTKFNRAPRNDDGYVGIGGLSIFTKNGCAKGGFKPYHLGNEEFNQACAYVLQNCEDVWPFIEEHKSELTRKSVRNVSERHNKEFPNWFYQRVNKLFSEGQASDDLLSLAIGPLKLAHRHSAYVVNGFRFHTKDRAVGRRTQNSGVLVRGDDESPDKEYYGVLKDILELSYVGERKVTLFNCHWWDVARLGRGYKVDSYGYTSVNIHSSLTSNEPFILASQAEQVFYVQDLVNSDWLVVVKTSPRDLYKMPLTNDENLDDDDDDDSNDDEEDAYQGEDIGGGFDMTSSIEINDNLTVMLCRDDVEPSCADLNVENVAGNSLEDNFINDDDIFDDVDSESNDVDEPDIDEYSSTDYNSDH